MSRLVAIVPSVLVALLGVGCGSDERVVVGAPDAAVASDAPLRSLDNELGSFSFTIDGLSPEAQIDFLRARGFRGIAVPWPSQEQAQRFMSHPAVLDGTFRIHALLVAVTFGAGGWNRSEVEPMMRLVAGTKTQLWTVLMGPLDDALTKTLQELGDLAAGYGATTVLYPHDGESVNSTEVAVAAIKRSGRENLKVSLHLAHEHKAGNAERLAEVIANTIGFVAAATINGAYAVDGLPHNDFDRTILPLYAGDFDVQERYLRPLVAAGYRGPMTLHTWHVSDPIEVHFSGSIARWHQMSAAVALELGR